MSLSKKQLKEIKNKLKSQDQNAISKIKRSVKINKSSTNVIQLYNRYDKSVAYMLQCCHINIIK